MTPQNIATFLFAYFICATAIALSTVIWRSSRGPLAWFVFSITVLGAVASVAIGSLLNPGSNFPLAVYGEVIAFSRTDLLSVGLGLSCALPLALLWRSGKARAAETRGAIVLASFAAIIGVVGTLLFGGMFSAKEILSPYFTHPETEFDNARAVSRSPSEYVVEDYLETALIPVRIAVSPDGTLYASGHRGIAAQEGAVIRIDPPALSGGQPKEVLVAKMLNRPYGLIAQNDRLFVSRSGQHTRWNRGKAEQISTGAVTLLKDLDGDGEMDYYHDIVSDLPGAKGPDYLHQNNAIAMSDSGELYITTAHHTDGHPATDPLEGVILKATGEDFETLETIATGLRNPFGLAFSQTGELFATDNDAQTGKLGGNPGDKLLHVTEGAFFGHPYADEASPAVSPHALRSKFSLGGLVRAIGLGFPEGIRDSLFVVVYGEGKIMQVELIEQQGIYSATLKPFATVPGAVDVAASPDGDFYVAVYPNKIVKLRQKRGTR